MIRGQKVAMRPVEPSDLPFLRELANDPAIAISVGGWSFHLSDYGQTVWWNSAVQDARTHRFIVIDNAEMSIGATSLAEIDWHDRRAGVGVRIHPDRVTEKGMGTDAMKALMAYAFYDVGLHRLSSELLAFNAASMGMTVKNCGWRIEGILREHVLRGGRYRDAFMVAALKADFDALGDAQEYVDRIVPVNIDRTLAIPPEWWAPGIAPV